MSEIAGTLAQQRIANRQLASKTNAISTSEELVLPAPQISLLLLIAITLLSALSVVYVKDYNRRLFATVQNMQKEHLLLQAEEGKLLFEQSLAASRTYVQEVAERELDMQVPMARNVVMIKASENSA